MKNLHKYGIIERQYFIGLWISYQERGKEKEMFLVTNSQKFQRVFLEGIQKIEELQELLLRSSLGEDCEREEDWALLVQLYASVKDEFYVNKDTRYLVQHELAKNCTNMLVLEDKMDAVYRKLSYLEFLLERMQKLGYKNTVRYYEKPSLHYKVGNIQKGEICYNLDILERQEYLQKLEKVGEDTQFSLRYNMFLNNERKLIQLSCVKDNLKRVCNSLETCYAYLKKMEGATEEETLLQAEKMLCFVTGCKRIQLKKEDCFPDPITKIAELFFDKLLQDSFQKEAKAELVALFCQWVRSSKDKELYQQVLEEKFSYFIGEYIPKERDEMKQKQSIIMADMVQRFAEVCLTKPIEQTPYILTSFQLFLQKELENHPNLWLENDISVMDKVIERFQLAGKQQDSVGMKGLLSQVMLEYNKEVSMLSEYEKEKEALEKKEEWLSHFEVKEILPNVESQTIYKMKEEQKEKVIAFLNELVQKVLLLKLEDSWQETTKEFTWKDVIG